MFNSKFPYQTQPKPLTNFSNHALLSRVVCQFCQDLWGMKMKENSNSLEGLITNVQLQTYRLKDGRYIKDKFGDKSYFCRQQQSSWDLKYFRPCAFHRLHTCETRAMATSCPFCTILSQIHTLCLSQSSAPQRGQPDLVLGGLPYKDLRKEEVSCLLSK